MMQQAVLHVGQRLQIGSERATVRYIGSIDGQSGEWVGLEWDDPARGKHDGSVAGRRYFSCACAEGAGSFVRLEKLRQTARTGISVLQGLRARYQDAVSTAVASRFALVGEQAVREHQSQLRLLLKASLSDDSVSSPGAEGELTQAAPALVELNLSGTLLGSWRDALSVAQQLPSLRQLDLSRTRMALPDPGAPLQGPAAVSRLHMLVLNDGHVSWAQIASLSSSLPALRELFLCNNGISSLADGAAMPEFQHLQVLDLTNNRISDWDEVRSLGSLPSLSTLNLGSNQLADLSAPLGAGFSSLRALLCANNHISKWATVQHLAELSRLCDTRFTGNPLFTTGNGDRFEVIARMPGLTLLNGSTVDARERRDSELHYLRGLLAQVEEQPAQLPALEAAHPCLAPLREKFGLMTGLARSQTSQGGTAPMAASLLTLHLITPGDGRAAVKLSKSVPGCITLKTLKYIMAQLHQVPMQCQQLLVHHPGQVDIRSLAGEDDASTLTDMGVKDQSEVRVQLRPMTAHFDKVRSIQSLFV